MMLPVWLSIALLLTVTGAPATPSPSASPCLNVESDAILARDLAQALPVFSALPPDTPIGFAPIPGVRRFFHASELRRIAARYHIAYSTPGDICFQQPMETLEQQPVVDAMRRAIGQPSARIEIKELSRYPVPRGEVTFDRSTLPAAPSLANIATPQLWTGFVRYGGNHRYSIWARAIITVRSVRVVAVEDLPAGRPIEARQVRREEFDTTPSNQAPSPSLDQIVGKAPRRLIAASSAVTMPQLDEPNDIQRGELVDVIVRSGAAKLELEGRALADGRKGDMIPVKNTANGKNFSARVEEKGRVVLIANLPATLAKEPNQ
jgi:flagella basal body P-ring formation protein FlgA